MKRDRDGGRRGGARGISRRRLLAGVPLTAAALVGLDRTILAETGSVSPKAGSAISFPLQDPALVREVVLKSHFDPDRVEELVEERPELAKSSVDWGFGDWESALGAASHTGRREIASLLIDHGARPNLFTHAMLGHLGVVRAAVTAQPGIQSIHGPHGITLLAHAQAGGEAAQPVVEYLEGLGNADPALPVVERPLPIAAYTGTFRYGKSADQTFRITAEDARLSFEKDGMFPRTLIHLGGGEHHPMGAPSIRFAFKGAEGKVPRIEIRDGSTTISARRIGLPDAEE